MVRKSGAGLEQADCAHLYLPYQKVQKPSWINIKLQLTSIQNIWYRLSAFAADETVFILF